MVRKSKIPIGIALTLIFLSGFYHLGRGWGAPFPTGGKIPYWMARTRQTLRSVRHTLKPFLAGTLPKKVYLRLFQLIRRYPQVNLKLTGHHLRLEKLVASLFPEMFRKVPLHGLANFTLFLKHEPSGIDRVYLRLKLNAPHGGESTLFSAVRSDLRIRLTLHRSFRRAAGTLICHIMGPSLTLTAPLKTCIRASEISIQASLANTRYQVTGVALGIRVPRLMWKPYSLQKLHIQRLSLSSKGITVHSLSARFHSQSLALRALSLQFSALRLILKGSLTLNLKGAGLMPHLPVESLKGPVSFDMTGVFRPASPTLSGLLKVRGLQIKPFSGPTVLSDLTLRLTFKNGGIELAPFCWTLNRATHLKATFRAPSFTSPLSDAEGAVSLETPHLKHLQPLLTSLFPDYFSNLKATGNLSLTARCHLTQGTLQTRGKIRLTGSFKNIMAPIVVKHARLALPFNLCLPLPHSPDGPVAKPFNSYTGPGLLKISKLKFGFLKLKDISSNIRAEGQNIRLGSLVCTVLHGGATGTGKIRLIAPYAWDVALHLNRVSLHELCDQIPGLSDALSGRVNAYLTLSGDGGKLDTIQGKFKAKTIKTDKEPMHISQAFIRKLTGKKGRFFFYRKYRPYNKGIIEAEIHRGMICFKTLEISHRLLGFKDLSMSVSPLANRISLKDLIWEILQVPNGQNMAHPVIKTK